MNLGVIKRGKGALVLDTNGREVATRQRLMSNISLPELSQTQLAKAYDTKKKQDEGMKFNCGHDFWENKAEYGAVVFCSRCGQFFVKVRNAPWIIRSAPDLGAPSYKLNDYPDRTCYVPVNPRLSEHTY